jgi:hypothetical protein
LRRKKFKSYGGLLIFYAEKQIKNEKSLTKK